MLKRFAGVGAGSEEFAGLGAWEAVRVVVVVLVEVCVVVIVGWRFVAGLSGAGLVGEDVAIEGMTGGHRNRAMCGRMVVEGRQRELQCGRKVCNRVGVTG